MINQAKKEVKMGRLFFKFDCFLNLIKLFCKYITFSANVSNTISF